MSWRCSNWCGKATRLSSSDGNAAAPRLHFAGVGGSGMSALAMFETLRGARASGSDRAFDQGQHPDLRGQLEHAGVVIVPQDGTFLDPAYGACDGLVVSTAVEDQVPDVAAARRAGVPILHRSELLARHVASHRSVAVSGTSGKSTVTGMVFAILQGCGRRPGLLTGGALADLVARGEAGNVRAPGAAPDGGAPWLVVEADESDGSLVRYEPWLGVVLNLGLDHKQPDEILAMFRTFRARTRGPFIVADEPNLADIRAGAVLFGVAQGDVDEVGDDGGYRARDIALSPRASAFTVRGTAFTLTQPGRHNVLNATAAIAACAAAGVAVPDMAAPLAAFGGIARRFQSLGNAAGVEVIDDFAHNPDKIAAALATAHGRLAPGGRVLAVFQPHGFGPTRFLKDALIAAFSEHLAPWDVLWLPEIFFAGGTVTRDISSADLVAGIIKAGRDARFEAGRDSLAPLIAAEARPGDVVLVMGARDPSLTAFGRDCLMVLASATDH
jgi:UDP-N-acetylmuramate--alanine ligase